MDNEQILQKEVEALRDALDGAQIIVGALVVRAGGSILISLKEINEINTNMFEQSKHLSKHYDYTNESVELRIESNNAEHQPANNTIN